MEAKIGYGAELPFMNAALTIFDYSGWYPIQDASCMTDDLRNDAGKCCRILMPWIIAAACLLDCSTGDYSMRALCAPWSGPQ